MLTPSRLTLARQRRGVTKVRLAESVELSVRSISAYENGHQEPSAQSLHDLARALAVPVAFLEAEEVDEIPAGAISFRAPSKLPAARRDMARSAGRIGVMLADWITDRFRLPTPDVPSLSRHSPEDAAAIVRARWGLGESPVGDMLRLLEYHGVRVFSLAAECADVDAFSFYWHGTPYVFLNTSKSGERGRFDAAHELGHLVLHGDHREPHGPDAEQEANRFAASFLMPAASVLAQPLRNASIGQVLAAKAIWRVSAMALTHRLGELGLLTEWGYRAAFVNLARAGYRTDEPGGIPRETSQLLSKVFRALRAEGITPATAAHELHITVDELNSHVFGLIPTVVGGGKQTSIGSRPKLRLVQAGKD
ncbi:XRE family transcriptional regulator [Longispora sp. NPDC051575]|uniref:helix-turn-helix domain-containing protein n=1 Tax=Longispora sp. NPDC051575 TaxID=3154943 RepID=UPI00342681A3